MAVQPSLAEARSHNVPPEVFLRHWQEIRDCKNQHAESGMALARAKKAAKNAGIDLDAFKMVEKLSDMDNDEVEMQLRHARYYAEWLKLPLGGQLQMFAAADIPQPAAEARDKHDDWSAGEAGLSAGNAGKPRDENPHQPGTSLHVSWDKKWAKGNKAWLKGQGKLAGDLGRNAEAEAGAGTTARSGGRGRGARTNGEAARPH